MVSEGEIARLLRLPRILLVSGTLGSDKSVPLVNIVGDLHSDSVLQLFSQAVCHPAIAYFFCQYSNQDTRSFKNIIGSLAHQMLKGWDR